MFALAQVVLIVFVIVMAAELLWRTKKLNSEQSRKVIHISVGTFAATWAFYLNDQQILLLSLAMLAVVLVSRALGIFASIHSVKRKTLGEIFFPLGIMACALLTDSPWIYMAALLHVSIADGLAALIGSRHIRKHGYKILGHQKTVVGTLIFFNMSVLITLLTVYAAPELRVGFVMPILIPLLTTLAENIGFYGADDLVLPLLVTGLFISL